MTDSQPAAELLRLRDAEYVARLRVTALRRRLYDGGGLPDDPDARAALVAAEDALTTAVKARQDAQRADTRSGVVLDTTRDPGVLGAGTTRLEARIELRMDYVPTSIAHLMTAADHPLLRCTVKNRSNDIRRLRVTSLIDGYSASSVETAEIEGQQEHEFRQLPALRPEAVVEVHELTRATLNVLVEDIAASGQVELHQSVPIWLLPRTSAPLAIQDPVTGDWVDMAPYLGAFVTPNAPSVMTFLRTVAERVPDRALVGYQGDESTVEPQVRAMFDALHDEGRITYVNSVLTSSPEEGFADQRVRLPRESLADGAANCIDGTVLYASLMEAASLNPAIVVVPGHAFVAWETWEGNGTWAYLETTMTGGGDFAAARASAEQSAAMYGGRGDGPDGMRRLSVRELRTQRRITPME
jgi:hypothetical protein